MEIRPTQAMIEEVQLASVFFPSPVELNEIQERYFYEIQKSIPGKYRGRIAVIMSCADLAIVYAEKDDLRKKFAEQGTVLSNRMGEAVTNPIYMHWLSLLQLADKITRRLQLTIPVQIGNAEQPAKARDRNEQITLALEDSSGLLAMPIEHDSRTGMQ